MVPQPVLAVLLLFPVTDRTEAARKAGKLAGRLFGLVDSGQCLPDLTGTLQRTRNSEIRLCLCQVTFST